MKKFLAIALLSLVAFSATAQEVISRVPQYERVFVQETNQVCEQRHFNYAGAIVGSVIGYEIGRSVDRNSYRSNRQWHGGYYDNYRGGYYRDSRHGRYGSVIGGTIGSQVNTGPRCYTANSGRGYWREVQVGYTVTYRDSRGNIFTQFEPR